MPTMWRSKPHGARSRRGSTPSPRGPMRSSTGRTRKPPKEPFMAERLPLTLKTYRLLSSVAGRIAPTIVRYPLKQGKEHPERFRERYGESKLEPPVGPLVWVHAASVGELLAVIPLIGRIREREFNVLCT